MSSWRVLVAGGEFEAENEDEPNCGGYALEALAAPEVLADTGGQLTCVAHPELAAPFKGPLRACAVAGGRQLLACPAEAPAGAEVALCLQDLSEQGAVEAPPARLAAPSGWPARAAPALAAGGGGSAGADGVDAFAAGGQGADGLSDRLWALSLKTGSAASWRELPPLPEGGCAHFALSAWSGGVVAAGGILEGKRRSSAVHFLDPRGSWEAWSAFPAPVAYHALASPDDGRLWSVGGHGDDGLLRCAWSLDPREGSWAEHPLGGPRWSHGLAAVPGALVAVGGYGAYGSRYRLRYVGTAEVLDLRRLGAARSAPLAQARAKAAAVALLP